MNKKRLLAIALMAMTILGVSCYRPTDPRVQVQEGVRSDTLNNNTVTRIVGHAFSDLIGQRIKITDVVVHRNKIGLLEIQVNGYNESYKTVRFSYKVEWLDESGMLVTTKTTTWLPMSATGNSSFGFKSVSPSPDAVNFRMNTRKWE
jgi:uncharacterized protein YcfL